MTDKLTVLLRLCLGTLPVWAALRGGWLLLRRQKPKPWREIALALFVVFMAGVLCMALDGAWASPAEMLQSALDRLETGERISLRPLALLARQLTELDKPDTWTQLLGNTLLFAPWGFCLPLLWRRFRKTLRMTGMALLLTCGIEFIQLFISRYVEIDDVILNFLGAMGGAGLWWIVHRCLPGMDKHLL